MAFNVGDTVVYPHHGAALIESVEMRKIKGEDREYLVLRVAQGDLTVRVPADNVDLVGVRDVVNAEGLDKVFTVLRQPYTEEPTNWSRRYKANLEKLASGDVIKVRLRHRLSTFSAVRANGKAVRFIANVLQEIEYRRVALQANFIFLIGFDNIFVVFIIASSYPSPAFRTSLGQTNDILLMPVNS